MSAFLAGVIAGYGIAVPVGPIAVLIVGIGTRSGFRRAFSAGLGAALADLIYAAIAAVAGAAAAKALAPYSHPLRITGGIVLVVIAVLIARSAFRPSSRQETGPATNARATAGFLSLTLMNPVTLTYFAALILGGGGVSGVSSGLLFVAGAFLASLSWQTTLAGTGAVLGHKMSDRARVITGLVGAIVILVLAIGMLAGA